MANAGDKTCPSLTVAGFIFDGRQLLLTKRPNSKQIAPGLFHLPGGHVEQHESAEEALRRELREELGVELEVGRPFHTFSYISPPECHGITTVFFVKFRGPKTSFKVDPSETEQIVWVKPQKLIDYLAENDPTLLAAKAGLALIGVEVD